MTRHAVALALLLAVACSGGGSSSPADPVDPAANPVADPAAVPAAGPPGAPAPEPSPAPSDGPAPTAPGGGGSPGQSCAISVRIVAGRSEYDERCSANGRPTSRQCTLETGDSAWSCLCTAASGASSTCQAPAPSSGVMPPPNCCPAG